MPSSELTTVDVERRGKFSASSSLIGVARNAPATTLIPLACTLLIAWITLPCLVFSGSNHASVPYVIVSRTTDLYTNLALAKDAPHVEVVTRLKAAIENIKLNITTLRSYKLLITHFIY